MVFFFPPPKFEALSSDCLRCPFWEQIHVPPSEGGEKRNAARTCMYIRPSSQQRRGKRCPPQPRTSASGAREDFTCAFSPRRRHHGSKCHKNARRSKKNTRSHAHPPASHSPAGRRKRATPACRLCTHPTSWVTKGTRAAAATKNERPPPKTPHYAD